MADKKVILAKYKPIVTNVTNKDTLAKFSNSEINIYVTGAGETSVPEAGIGYYISDYYKSNDSTIIEVDYVRQHESFYSLADSSVFLAGKGLHDEASTSEELSKESATQLNADTVRTADAVSSAANFNRYFEENTKYFESPYLVDNTSYTLGYNFKFIDDYSNGFGKNVVDSFVSFDSSVKLFGKGLTETASFTESFSTLSVFNSGLGDIATTDEIITRQFGAQRSYTDTFTKAETKTANIQNYFGSGYSLTGYVGTNYAI